MRWQQGQVKLRDGSFRISEYFLRSDEGYQVSKAMVDDVWLYQAWSRSGELLGIVKDGKAAMGLCLEDFERLKEEG